MSQDLADQFAGLAEAFRKGAPELAAKIDAVVGLMRAGKIAMADELWKEIWGTARLDMNTRRLLIGTSPSGLRKSRRDL